MYKEHPCFMAPDEGDSAIIWRYMDFTKFVSLLEKEALFFVRGDKLNDPFEGEMTKGDEQLFRNSLEQNRVPRDRIDELILAMRSTHSGMKRYIAINSWCMSEYECAAMWGAYLKSDEGIAIRSTYGSLKRSFENWDADEIHIGTVKYMDYVIDLSIGQAGSNIFYSFLWKRMSYSYEKELRAAIMRTPITDGKIDMNMNPFNDTENGVYISVELDTLVDKVFVSPIAAPWFKELVKSVMETYHLEKEIELSSLADRPVF